MFRFADLGRVSVPVAIGEATIQVDFKVLTRKELRALQRQALTSVLASVDASRPTSEAEVQALVQTIEEQEAREVSDLEERVMGWRGVVDADGAEVSFSPDRLSAMLAVPYIAEAFMRGLQQASREGPAKNSSPGPAGQPARDQA